MGLPRQEFIKRMNQYEGSGLNVTAFCKLHGISTSRFYYYQKKKGQSTSKPREVKPCGFEPITVSKQEHPAPPVKAVIYFPNQVHCELSLSGHDERLKLLKELARL